MSRPQDVLTFASVVYGWCAAALAYPLILVLAAMGQGMGALVGGCEWIGISIAPHRQVWALVNQPAVNFSSTTMAYGYWWGSSLVPLAVAICAVRLLPRARSVAGEIFTLQLAWAAAVVGCCWMPLVDLHEGHLVTWLGLNDMNPYLVGIAPALGTMAACLPTLGLLSLARAARFEPGRRTRLAIVLLHFGAPVVAWLVIVSVLRQGPHWIAVAGMLLPLAAAFAVAWLGYPRALVQPLQRLSAGSWIAVVLGLALVVAAVAVAGRPVEPGRVSGLLWGTPGKSDNIKQWIKPMKPFRNTPRPGGQSLD